MDGPLQFEIIAIILILTMAASASVALWSWKGLEEASYKSGESYHSIQWTFAALKGPAALSILVGALAAALAAFFWSHRIDAPLRVLAAAFERLGEGRFGAPVRLRAGDAHKELAAEFSRMEQGLKKLIDQERSRCDMIHREMEDVVRELPDDLPAKSKLASLSREIRSVLSRL